MCYAQADFLMLPLAITKFTNQSIEKIQIDEQKVNFLGIFILIPDRYCSSRTINTKMKILLFWHNTKQNNNNIVMNEYKMNTKTPTTLIKDLFSLKNWISYCIIIKLMIYKKSPFDYEWNFSRSNSYCIDILPFLSIRGRTESPSLWRVFLTLRAVNLTSDLGCQHSFITRKTTPILYGKSKNNTICYFDDLYPSQYASLTTPYQPTKQSDDPLPTQ
jgi:hypothetical protein